MELVTPEYLIEPYSEVMKCWYTTIPEDAFVTVIQSWQGDYGHHVIGFLTDESHEEVPDGTVVDCIEPEAMARYVPILTPTLTPNDNNRVDIPGGLALKLNAGSRLAVQSHYVNTSGNTLRRSDTVRLEYAEDSDDVIAAAPWMALTFDTEIPAGGEYSESYDCPVDEHASIYSVVGHMHEAGAKITVDAGPADALTEIYSVDNWEDEFRDNPPIKWMTGDDAFPVAPNDILRVSCTWDASHEKETLEFPTEMCASVLWHYPADEPKFCVGTL